MALPTTPGANYVTESLLDAKLEAVEARTETKFAQLLGELKIVSNSITNLGTQIGEVKTATATVKWNIIATGLAIGALVLGLFAYGQAMMQVAAGLVGLKH